jgi:AcrR family transcriptional regulator
LKSKDELLEVAIDLFAANGYAGTSIRDIANAVGRSVSNVYHHFRSKEDLWLAILEYSVRGLPERLREVAYGDAGPLENFKLLLRTHLQSSAQHWRESKIFFIDEERLSPDGKKENRRIQKEILDIYVEQLRILQSHGLIRTKNIRVLAFNVLGVVNWFLRWYDPERGPDIDEVYDEIVEFVLFGACGKEQ